MTAPIYRDFTVIRSGCRIIKAFSGSSEAFGQKRRVRGCKVTDSVYPQHMQLFLCVSSDEKQCVHRKREKKLFIIFPAYESRGVRFFIVTTEFCEGFCE